MYVSQPQIQVCREYKSLFLKYLGSTESFHFIRYQSGYTKKTETTVGVSGRRRFNMGNRRLITLERVGGTKFREKPPII